ncbi:MAG TPA: AmmeMemoRadiSam system protein A [Spirochaetes bacterium]|nr:AmmeMemoRadiSam system protein A [Spirochaetota bacterium]
MMVELSKEQKIRLLRLARAVIEARLENSPVPAPDMGGEFSEPVFLEQCGAFVTIHRKGRLRGCIGYIQGMKNIPDTVVDMAQSSAFRDPRFAPLGKEEFSDIDLEISVLSPIEPVRDIADIKVGRDGLIISRGMNSGLLLPQVATEYEWDLETFLEHTCFKAGLPGDAWKKEGTKIEKFSAQVFSEKELGLV